MTTPSTAWREKVESDEASRFEAIARGFVEMQALKSAEYGKGRALHRKGLTAFRAELTVLPGLPAHASEGIFAKPGTYEAAIRLSHGSPDVQRNKTPDIRGFAVKVRGVHGPSALGGDTDCQDWLLINHDRFVFTGPDEFAEFALAAAKGPLALVSHGIRRYGLGIFGVIKDFHGVVAKPFSGFATEVVGTVLPFAMGPWAARLRLVPDGNGAAAPDGEWGADIARRLAVDALLWDVQLQFFVDEATTPIEDAKAGWTNQPWLPVATLTAPKQDLNSAEGKTFAASVENENFDPWHALAANRPLGSVMRARKVVYFATQNARKS